MANEQKLAARRRRAGLTDRLGTRRFRFLVLGNDCTYFSVQRCLRMCYSNSLLGPILCAFGGILMTDIVGRIFFWKTFQEFLPFTHLIGPKEMYASKSSG